jgi:hypothetical protein
MAHDIVCRYRFICAGTIHYILFHRQITAKFI